MNKNKNSEQVVNKRDYEPFKIRATMMELDKYLRVFIIPQIPAEYKEYREAMRQVMDKAWHAMYHAALTEKRERQKHLLELKIELMMISVYLEEIREVCYRGKMKKKLDATTTRRFEICAKRQHDVMEIVWGWIENEATKMDPSRAQSTAGLIEKEER